MIPSPHGLLAELVAPRRGEDPGPLAAFFAGALPHLPALPEGAAWIEGFALHLATLDGDGPPARWEELRLEDLWLAFRALRGDRAAASEIDRAALQPALAHLTRGDGAAEDAVQAVRIALFVGDAERPPRLAAYAGRGDLRKWVRVAVTRTWLNAKRSTRREVSEEDALVDGPGFDAELALLKGSYRDLFRKAFRAALDALPARTRTLLRQHYLDGLTMEQIGALHGVHRITVFRWVDGARAELATATRAHLAAALAVEDRDVQSVLRMISSQLDFGLRTALGEER